MRPASLSWIVPLFALSACGSSSASSSPQDSGLLAAEDGSTAGCTGVGGTCIPYTGSCPVAQQDTALCENSILICCLPPGGEKLPTPEGGDEGGPPPGDGGSVVDSAMPTDSATMMDTSMPMDSSKPTDSSTPVDSAMAEDSSKD
jgi:hypothetical protein